MKINSRVASIDPYIPSDRNINDGILRLDWNEPTRPVVRWDIARFSAHLTVCPVNRYPSSKEVELAEMVAEYIDVSPSSLEFYNGSDSAIANIINLFVDDESTVVIFRPTYNQVIPLIQSRTKQIIFSDILDPFSDHIYDFDCIRGASLVYLPNPNNPTGYSIQPSKLQELFSKHPETVFVIDEAYQEFTNSSVSNLTSIFDNVLVTRSLSKAFGLPGIRFGYVVGSSSLLRVLRLVKNVKEVSVPSLFFAKVAFSSSGLSDMRTYVAEVGESKNLFYRYLAGREVTYRESDGNFVLFRPPNFNLFLEECKTLRVAFRPRLSDGQLDFAVRATVGDLETTRRCLEILDKMSGLSRCN
jgi:histidinol-phosphate aminotransferase